MRLAVRQLNAVIDKTFYPIESAGTSNREWRNVALGIMGLQDVFFQLHLPFDSAEATALSTRIQEEIYFHALTASAALAEVAGPHPTFDQTRIADGQLQFDLWNVIPAELDGHFPEFRPFVTRCEYAGCTHLDQEGCGVRQAVDEGWVDSHRYYSYRGIHQAKDSQENDE